MTEKELYNEYRSCNCKSFTDFLINKIAELKKQLVEKGQHLDLTEREWAKDLNKQIHFKTLCTKLEKENAELKSENQKWKDEWQEQVQKATDEGYASTLQTMQLTKAKELLKEFVHHYKNKTIYIENMQDLLEQVERFIKDSEVEK